MQSIQSRLNDFFLCLPGAIYGVKFDKDLIHAVLYAAIPLIVKESFVFAKWAITTYINGRNKNNAN